MTGVGLSWACPCKAAPGQSRILLDTAYDSGEQTLEAGNIQVSQ